ncbi:MAG: DUF1820 family protein [Thermoanaerobaculia bacterium]
MTTSRIFRVSFLQQGKVYEIYVEGVAQGSLLGFVEIEGLLFGERSQVVLDPSEERLKTEFKGVNRVYLPLHSVLRIDEVEKTGTPRIRDAEGAAENISHFPLPMIGPQGDSTKS